ncbi:MAG: DNA-binding protein WhiA [Clostridia bacterium]|nr:DNA-binding protein WhiA [Clostridia bacterium]
MSFSFRIKNELCKIEEKSLENKLSEIYGVILFSKYFKRDNGVILKTENKSICDRFAKTFSSCFNITPNVEIQKNTKKNYTTHKSLYTLAISHKADRLIIWNYFNLDDFSFKDKFINLKKKICTVPFLRGIFLVCGNLIDPTINYHLEWNVKSLQLAELLKNSLSELDLNLRVNYVFSKNKYLVYMKAYENIVDFLTFIGVQASVMDIIQVKMLKEVRNQINRTTNFEAANINKTAIAATEQILAIRKLKKTKRFEKLTPELKELANLRLNNPQMSLKELGENLSGKLTRFSVNYRLKKIVAFAKS